MNNANVQTLPTLTARILHALLFTPTPDGWGIPGFIWGPPGVGKTKMAAAVAENFKDFGYVRLSPAERGEGQFGVIGVPKETDKGLRLVYPAPDWVDDVDDGGLVFVDEFNLGGYALQAPMLGLIQLRTIGAHTLGNRVRMLAAANQAHDAPGAVDVANSVANRFAHFSYTGLDNTAWADALATKFALLGGGDGAHDAREEEARVVAAWNGAYAKAAAVIGGFVAKRPDLHHVEPPKGKKTLIRPTPRTWEYATLALASSAVHGLTEVETDAYLSAIIGIETVTELAAWRAELDLPDAADLLDGKVAWRHDSQRPDRTEVVLRNIGSLMATSEGAAESPRIEKAWEIIGAVNNEASDLAVPGALMMFDAGLTFPRVKSPKARKVQAAIFPVIQAAKALD